jgi:hypothetical protein
VLNVVRNITVAYIVYPLTGSEVPEGDKRYSFTLSLTSALEVGGWSTPRPGRFTPGKETRYPFYRRLDEPQGGSERMRNIAPPTGNRSPDLPGRSEPLHLHSYDTYANLALVTSKQRRLKVKVGTIIIGKLGLGNKEQMLVNIHS